MMVLINNNNKTFKSDTAEAFVYNISTITWESDREIQCSLNYQFKSEYTHFQVVGIFFNGNLINLNSGMHFLRRNTRCFSHHES